MSTLEDAQALLSFITATWLHSSKGHPARVAAPLGVQDVAMVQEGCDLSPQEGSLPDSRLPMDPATPVSVLGPSSAEAGPALQTPSEGVAGVPDGGLGTHVVTNIYLYPIKSCAAFEVRTFSLFPTRIAIFICKNAEIIYVISVLLDSLFLQKQKGTEQLSRCLFFFSSLCCPLQLAASHCLN